MNILPSAPEWARIRPLLDDALDRLGCADRDALILRYFEQRSLAEVGQFLGLNEDAARKRVNRTLDKLRAALARSGVTSIAAALDIVLTGKTVELAPPGLAMQVAHRACTAGAAGTGLTASLGQLLTVTKAKVVGTGAVVVVAIILMIVNHHGRNLAGAVSLASPNKPIVSAATPTSPGAETAANAVASSNALVLHFVAADNGSVIPNVEVEFWSLGQKGREHGQLRAGDFDWDNIFGKIGVRWLHTGGIFAALSDTTPQVVIEAVQKARQYGTLVSYDLNYRPSLWKSIGGQKRAQEVNREIVRYVDMMIGNEEDFTAGLGFHVEGGDENLLNIDVAAFKRMIETAVKTYPNFKAIATTLRAAKTATVNNWAAIVWMDGGFFESRKYPDLEILDRVGGGDSFASGFIYGLMTTGDAQRAVDYGAAHGALAMTTPGDTSMADIKEVEKLMRGGGARVQR